MSRAADIFWCVLLLPIWLTAILILIIPVVLVDRFYPFFKQNRIGKYGENFTSIKIQAMHPTKDVRIINDKEADKLRVTRLVGRLRDHGLDELPQFINVLKGDMSVIGPRPLLAKNIAKIEILNPELISKINHWKDLRYSVKPGITGWHQIHSLGQDIIKYDTEYLTKPTFKKKLKIFLVTVWIILVGKEKYFGVGDFE